MRKETFGANYYYHDVETLMEKGYPKIVKTGACSSNGEMTPFMWKGRLMRLELVDPSKGWVKDQGKAAIRDVESGEFLSYFGSESYYHAACVYEDTLYVTAVHRERRDTILLYETHDLKTWEVRDLLTNPDWKYCNSSLVYNGNEWIIALETGPSESTHQKEDEVPRKYLDQTGGWTTFFAKSKDLKTWEHLDYSKFHRGGNPCLKYSEGWYYLITGRRLPHLIFTDYIFRSRDLENWYVSYYNPIALPNNMDKEISPRFIEITPEERERIRTAVHVNTTDYDMCDWNGKTYINYACGNQLGNYWMGEAICDLPLKDFLKSFFDE